MHQGRRGVPPKCQGEEKQHFEPLGHMGVEGIQTSKAVRLKISLGQPEMISNAIGTGLGRHRVEAYRTPNTVKTSANTIRQGPGSVGGLGAGCLAARFRISTQPALAIATMPMPDNTPRCTPCMQHSRKTIPLKMAPPHRKEKI